MAPGCDLGYQSCAGKAAAGFAFGNVAATMDADGRWSGIEIGLQHPEQPRRFIANAASESF